jgi:hypothetical protein
LRTYIESSVVLTLGLAVAFLLPACGGASQRGPGSPQSAQDFPPYAGSAAQLFDDRIDPMAVGLADVSDNPRTDPILRARAQNAEVVGRTRVSTVTVDSVGGKPVYRLKFTFAEAPVVSRFSPDQIEVSVKDDSPAFGIVKWLDTKLIGHSFVGFFHRFAGSVEPVVRFHLSPDDPQVISAVRDASALSELLNP